MSTMTSEATAAAGLIDAWLSQGLEWTSEKRRIHDQIVQLLRSRGIFRHSGYTYRLASGRSFSREPDRRRPPCKDKVDPTGGSLIVGKVAGRRKRAR